MTQAAPMTCPFCESPISPLGKDVGRRVYVCGTWGNESKDFWQPSPRCAQRTLEALSALREMKEDLLCLSEAFDDLAAEQENQHQTAKTEAVQACIKQMWRWSQENRMIVRDAGILQGAADRLEASHDGLWHEWQEP